MFHMLTTHTNDIAVEICSKLRLDELLRDLFVLLFNAIEASTV